MRDETRAQRQHQIEEAAYALLGEKGYGATSMLSVARVARASNETLYRWYGDKRGLFKSMVETNAGDIRAALRDAIDCGADPLASLEKVAPVLLTMLLGEKAVLLNRAAAADETGELGAALAEGGRNAVAPLIEALLRQSMESGAIRAPSAATAAEWFLGLLIGDLQIRRVIGVLPEPGADFVADRVAGALAAFRVLCANASQG